MIPGADHSSRTLLLRRVSSWSEVATNTSSMNDDNNVGRRIVRRRVNEEGNGHDDGDGDDDDNDLRNNENSLSRNNNTNDGNETNELLHDDGHNNHGGRQGRRRNNNRRGHRRWWSYSGGCQNGNNNNAYYHDEDAGTATGGGGERGGGDQESLFLFSPPLDDSPWNASLSLLDGDLSQPLLPPSLEYEEDSAASFSTIAGRGSVLFNRLCRINGKLWAVFGLLVLSGVGNVLLAKMSSYRLYNYPTFLNIYSNIFYTLMSFGYIIPVGRFGLFNRSIPRKHWTSLPKRPFMIMGFLDATSATVQVLANVYLPGPILVLIPQAAIPLAMLMSWAVMRERYSFHQFVGAVVVLAGVLLALFPVFTRQREAGFYCRAVDEESECTICQIETTEAGCLSHIQTDGGGNNSTSGLFYGSLPGAFMFGSIHNLKNDTDNHHGHSLNGGNNQTSLYCKWVSRDEAVMDDDFLVFVWSILMLLSLVPMVMSTIYKQISLQVNLDPILVNGWVSFFQLFWGMALVVPAGLLSSPRVHPLQIGSNWRSGLRCLFQQTNTVKAGCHPDDCRDAALWVHLGLGSAIVYALSMMFVLKYGSCDLMYLGLTLVVPIAHLSFSLHSTADVSVFDVCGLLVSVTGLFMYRFGHEDPPSSTYRTEHEGIQESATGDYANGEHRRFAAGHDQSAVTDARIVGSERTGNSQSDAFQGSLLVNIDANSRNKKGDFLEFLREPFLLVGDI